MGAPIDAVYTWVDGAWPGYDALLRAHASDRHDLNPNRYRDNLDILRYNLRSLALYAPWIERVFLVTCRPQQPAWLDARAVRVVHHDEIMPPSALPTFNSFAIVSHLHRIPDLSRRFVYIEDDRLFGGPVVPADFFDDRARARIYLKGRRTMAPARREDTRLSPWNRALAESNRLLDERYGAKPRHDVSHGPLPIDIDSWRAMIEQWPDAFARTSASRFRATGNVAPEHLYPHFLLEEGGGVRAPRMDAWRRTAYHPLNNVMAFQRASLARLRWQRPTFFCMNDNFDQRPDPRVVARVRQQLDAWFPAPSRFERRS